MSLIATRKLHQYRGHVRTVAPASEPVTADDLRAHLRETSSGLGDTEANGLIAEARELIEEDTGLALITQTWLLVLDRWPAAPEPWWDGVRQMAITELSQPCRVVELPRYPLQSVSGVSVYDAAGSATAVAVADVFDVDVYQKPGRLALKQGQTWPIALRDTNGVQITYVAGYGASGASVPAALKRAVLTVAAYLYAHRGDDCDMGDALAGVASILSRFRVARL